MMPLGGVDDVHIVQEGDVKEVLGAGLRNQGLQCFDILGARRATARLLWETVCPVGLAAELIGVILVPGEALEDTLLENGEGLALDAGEVPFEREGLQPGGIVDEGELVGEDLLPDLVLAEERRHRVSSGRR